jgi:hypothetical protein
MFKTRSFWTIVALSAVATVATAQSRVIRTHTGGAGDAGGKIQRVIGDAGMPVCFGDGTGSKCPFHNFGSPGHGCDNSMGQGGALLMAQGIPSVSKDSMTLSVGDLPLGTTVIFMQAPRLADRPSVFGDGLMCLGGPVLQLAMKRASGGASMFPDSRDASLSRTGKIPSAGGTVIYQVLYRDSYPYTGRGQFNLSNAWLTPWAP